MQIKQNIGKIADKAMVNFVIKETPESSQLFFLYVVKRHAIDVKLRIEIIGVINGNTNIKRI